MIIVTWRDQVMECAVAVKGNTYVELYNDHEYLLYRIDNISFDEWQYISISGGEWTEPSEIPTDIDKLRADVDYILMLIDE